MGIKAASALPASAQVDFLDQVLGYKVPRTAIEDLIYRCHTLNNPDLRLEADHEQAEKLRDAVAAEFLNNPRIQSMDLATANALSFPSLPITTITTWALAGNKYTVTKHLDSDGNVFFKFQGQSFYNFADVVVAFNLANGSERRNASYISATEGPVLTFQIGQLFAASIVAENSDQRHIALLLNNGTRSYDSASCTGLNSSATAANGRYVAPHKDIQHSASARLKMDFMLNKDNSIFKIIEGTCPNITVCG
jgi:hypothetical protein